METINNLASTASKVIWGEPTTATNETAGKEPISGAQGQGTATEPFDQGNAATPSEPFGKSDPFNSASTAPTTTKTELPIRTTTNNLTKFTPATDFPESTPATDFPKSTSSTDFPESTPATDFPKSTSSTDFPQSTSSTDFPQSTSSTDFPQSTPSTNISKSTPSTDIPKSTPSTDFTPKSNETSTPHIPLNPTSAATGGVSKPLENTEGTGVTGATQKFTPTGGAGGDIRPSESANPGLAPASDAVPSQKQQGADRPSEAPVDNKEDDAEAFVKKRDPNDHSGEPMHMHNGPEKGESVPKTQEERRESKIGLPGGQEHGKEPKGTGEEWVKTSGLVADGGDFDATKPGAGKEADRLLEGKGVHRDAKGNMDSKPETGKLETSPGGADKEKVSKIDKLKEKLHIGHKDK